MSSSLDLGISEFRRTSFGGAVTHLVIHINVAEYISTLPLLGFWARSIPETSLAKELRRLSINLEPVRGWDRASRNETAVKVSVDSVLVMSILK